jgi:hypothetical protein
VFRNEGFEPAQQHLHASTLQDVLIHRVQVLLGQIRISREQHDRQPRLNPPEFRCQFNPIHVRHVVIHNRVRRHKDRRS